VCVFFVLSGFVLTRVYFLTKRTDVLTKGAIKRYVRLMPPVAVAVLGAFVLMRLGAFHNQQAAAISGSTGLGELWRFAPKLPDALNQAFVSTFTSGYPGPQSFDPVLWTMQIEFLGSMLVFAAAALFGSYRRRWLVYLVLAAFTWKTYYLGFVAGMLLADLFTNEGVRETIGRVRWGVWATVVGAGLLFGGYPSSGSTTGTVYHHAPSFWGHAAMWYPTWHTFGAILLVTVVLGWVRLQSVLNLKPFVELGRQSFGLYLTHFIVIATFSSYLFTKLHQSHGYRLSFVVTAAVSLVLIFAISWLFTQWVDGPAVRLAKRLTTEKPKQPQLSLPEPVPAAQVPLVAPAAVPAQTEL
jgi:peptidoglycan/LPS O-acetylase OafA/YrhL